MIGFACAASIVGCGDKDFSGAQHERKQTGEEKASICISPAVSPDSGAQVQTVSPGTPFVVDRGKIAKNSGRVELTVQGATTVRTVDDAFADKGTYRARPSDRFVVVEFTLKNLGDREVEAAKDIGSVGLLQGKNGKRWLRVDRAKGCSTVSPSIVHNGKGLKSPELDVGKGKKYRTVAAYAVPAKAGNLSWVVPGYQVPLEIRPARAE